MIHSSVSLPVNPQTLSPDTWPIHLDLLPQSAFLVGGSVRDALLGRRADYLDLDFVLPQDAIKTARAIAKFYGAGFVLLDAEHQIARVVFAQATLDFAQQVGGSLDADLHRRDFTVNAIAFNPHTRELLDPLQGVEDLHRGCIRMIAAANLQEDPLRLLRAYRQAAQLGFHIETTTQTTIQSLATWLQPVAAERVQGELNYLLSNPEGTPRLIQACQHQLFQHWLPDITTPGLDRLAALDQAALTLLSACPAVQPHIWGWIRSSTPTATGRSWLRLAKLTCLLAADAAIAEAQLWQLKYSRAEVQAAVMILRHWADFTAAVHQPLTRRQQYYLFQQVGTVFPALMVLSVAAGHSLAALLPLIHRFLDVTDAIAHPRPLITGRDLMTALNLAPSPTIGLLLKGIELAQAEDLVHTADEAIAWAIAQQDRTS